MFGNDDVSRNCARSSQMVVTASDMASRKRLYLVQVQVTVSVSLEVVETREMRHVFGFASAPRNDHKPQFHEGLTKISTQRATDKATMKQV